MGEKFKYEIGLKEFKSSGVLVGKQLFAEFLGIFLLNFFGAGSCTQGQDGTFMALAFGLAVFIAITAVGHISGGHVNPAVTCGMLAAGKISVLKAVLYIISQCLGAIAGTAALKALLVDDHVGGLGHTNLAPGISEIQGFGLEFFLGFVLVITVFGACDEYKPDSRFTAPLAIGMAVTLGHLGTIKYTGASMNPARTIGTAVMTGVWTAHWIYWAGPILGGIAASLIYNLILANSKSSNKYDITADDRELQKLESRR